MCSCAPYLKKGFKRLVLDSWKTRFLELRGFQIGDLVAKLGVTGATDKQNKSVIMT